MVISGENLLFLSNLSTVIKYYLGSKMSLEGANIVASLLLLLHPFFLLLVAHHNHLKDNTPSFQISLLFCQPKSAPGMDLLDFFYFLVEVVQILLDKFGGNILEFWPRGRIINICFIWDVQDKEHYVKIITQEATE